MEAGGVSLPVQLSTTTARENPEFVNLLSQLSLYITPDGGSVALQKELDEARHAMEKEKIEYLETRVLYLQLEDLLADHDMQSAQSSSSANSNSQFYETLRDLMTSAELEDYISCEAPSDHDTSTDTGTSLFGLKQSDLSVGQGKKLLESVRQKLIVEVENRLSRACDSLIAFTEPLSSISSGDTSARLALAKASQLPAIIESVKESLKKDTNEIMRCRISYEKQLAIYNQTLMDSLDILLKLLTEHKLKSQTQADNINSDWLTARCDTLRLKFKVLESQLLIDTYSRETVAALNSIRRELNLCIDDTQKDLAQSTEALRTYEAVGQGFDSLVQEYTKLCEEIANRKWALDELVKSSGTVDTSR